MPFHVLSVMPFGLPDLQRFVSGAYDGTWDSEVFCGDVVLLRIITTVCHHHADGCQFTGTPQQRNKINTIMPSSVPYLDAAYQLPPHVCQYRYFDEFPS
ncbi:MAG TPA: hypothetical protein VNK44_00700 [Candidatus Nitrosotenuis sp.]|nr:hypothetical protein [Candidatus Nitrosotenuis sp.]